jgi:hypothetical protein
MVSEVSIPPAYVALRLVRPLGTTKRVSVPARQAGNPFLGSLKRLQIRALLLFLACWEPTTGDGVSQRQRA